LFHLARTFGRNQCGAPPRARRVPAALDPCELRRRVPAVLITRMDKFIEQHADRISGTLGCFDRVLFRGYLPHAKDLRGRAFTQTPR